jgi:predicted Rossmann-fold nucleotide-binding protein
MRNICVYCGSSPGADPLFTTSAKALGRAIAETDRVLVYGGAKVGLMGALADSVLAAGGKVIGVVPPRS